LAPRRRATSESRSRRDGKNRSWRSYPQTQRASTQTTKACNENADNIYRARSRGRVTGRSSVRRRRFASRSKKSASSLFGEYLHVGNIPEPRGPRASQRDAEATHRDCKGACRRRKEVVSRRHGSCCGHHVASNRVVDRTVRPQLLRGVDECQHRERARASAEGDGFRRGVPSTHPGRLMPPSATNRSGRNAVQRCGRRRVSTQSSANRCPCGAASDAEPRRLGDPGDAVTVRRQALGL